MDLNSALAGLTIAGVCWLIFGAMPLDKDMAPRFYKWWGWVFVPVALILLLPVLVKAYLVILLG